MKLHTNFVHLPFCCTFLKVLFLLWFCWFSSKTQQHHVMEKHWTGRINSCLSSSVKWKDLSFWKTALTLWTSVSSAASVCYIKYLFLSNILSLLEHAHPSELRGCSSIEIWHLRLQSNTMKLKWMSMMAEKCKT